MFRKKGQNRKSEQQHGEGRERKVSGGGKKGDYAENGGGPYTGRKEFLKTVISIWARKRRRIGMAKTL